MKKILAPFFLLTLIGCGSHDTDSATSSFAEEKIQPEICTKDINPFGNPSSCQCDVGYSYDEKTGSCHIGGRITSELKWSPSQSSLQASLYQMLLRREVLDQDVIQLKDKKNVISCEVGKNGMISVQQYRCGFELEGAQLSWSSDANSLQARLYELIAFNQADGGLSSAVKLSDERGNVISCSMGTLGMAQVVSYRCSFELKSASNID